MLLRDAGSGLGSGHGSTYSRRIAAAVRVVNDGPAPTAALSMAHVPFHRPARRFHGQVAAATVQIASPPTVPPQASALGGALQAVLPMLILVGSMAFFFVVPLGNPILPLIMGGVMGLTVVGTVATKVIESKAKRRQRGVESTRYLAHLSEQGAALAAAEAKQRVHLVGVHPHPPTLLQRSRTREHLWERRPTDPDFLHGRIGLGPVPHAVRPRLDLGGNPMTSDYRPDLLAAAKDVVRRFDEIEAAPVAIDLMARSSVSFIGSEDQTRAAVRALLVHLAVSHAPEELAVVIYSPPESADQWEWAKWLPHARDSTAGSAAAPRCRLTTSSMTLGTILTTEVARRREALREHGGAAQQMLVIIDGYVPRSDVASLAVVAELLAAGREAATTVVTLVASRKSEPEHVEERIDIAASGVAHVQYVQPGADAEQRQISLDTVSRATAERIARELAPLRLRDPSAKSSHAASGSVRLLELLHIPSADMTNPAVSWSPRPALEVLRAPIGVGVDGEPIVIDLKESAMGGMGPHGLVVGATGSGKSELLRTLVSALAITHSPDTLNFVFVDFKGGAAFADLASLPHVAGMITNLQGDLSRVDRMYSALVGEQQRRQNLFRTAGNVDGIKEYQALYARRGEGMEPVPYLIIVVDEFGELLAARPDFLDLFNAIGRVGRSLGMHLLLSTQRLDEGRLQGLEGHLRYRICLRTFSAQESVAVLGNNDAFRLPSSPGAGYLRVDATLTRFQTALATAPYLGPHGLRGAVQGPMVLPFVGFRGPEIVEASGPAAPSGDDTPSEMEVAIDRLRDAGAAVAAPVHQVWLPPLATEIPLDDVLVPPADGGFGDIPLHPFGLLRAAVGIVDQPAQQAQENLILDFSAGAGHLRVAGAAHTGKSTLLRTIILSLCATHAPSEVQFYCVDYGGGALQNLQQLPHVGTVCGKQDRDRVRRLIREIQSVVESREIMFRKANIDSAAVFRSRRAVGSLPPGNHADIFLVIDNWGGFHADFEDIELELIPLLGTALAYGVHVIGSANRWADIRPNIRDNIGGRLELRLNDPTDSEMPRGAAKTLPAATPGRALLDSALQFQTALPRLRESAEDLTAVISRRFADEPGAPEIRLLPTNLELAELNAAKSSSAQGIAIGIDEVHLLPVQVDILGQSPHFLLLGDAESGKTNLLRLWMYQTERRYPKDKVQFLIVDYRRTLLDATGSEHMRAYAPTENLAKTMIADLRTDLVARLPSADVTREQLMHRSWWSGAEVVVVVDDYDLVVTPSGNPLTPLLDLLPHARDVGLHVLLARRVGGLQRTSFEPVFQRLRELGSPGIIFSGDPQEGYLIGNQKAANLPPGRGFLVRRGERTCQVQTAHIEPAG